MNKRTRPTRKGGRSQRAILRGLFLFLVFFVLNLLMENREQFEFSDSSCETAQADSTPFLYETIYPWITNHLLGDKPSGRVTIVFIPENLAEVQQNLCRGRAYVAALIDLLSAQQPAAIVVDKYYSAKSCLVDDQEKADTASLLNAVRSARAAKTTIIVGEATDAACVRTHDTCLVHNPDFLAFDPTADVPRGLTKLNANREQIPLQWLVLDSPLSHARDQSSPCLPDAPPPKVQEQDSLALVTARVVSAKTIVGPQFQTTLHSARQPYARLGLDLNPIASTDLLCHSADPDCPLIAKGNTPSEYRPKSPIPLNVHGKVVVVGSQNAVDRWDVLGKQRWGYELQAWYLDALLSGKYLRAVSGHWIFALSILFILFLEGVPPTCEFTRCFDHWPRVKAMTTKSENWVLLWPPVFIVIVLAICLARYFFPPLSLLAVALVTMFSRYFFNKMDLFEKQVVPAMKETQS